MSKKKKVATFKLEADGFSIHTLELSQQLSYKDRQKLVDWLYDKQKRDGSKNEWIYKDKEEKNTYVCPKYKGKGIRIKIKKIQSNEYMLYLTVNPRKVIDPNSSYRGILPNKKAALDDLVKKFKKRLKDSPFEENLNAYTLTRVDCCTNIACDYGKIFRETVRVLRKLPTPPKYTRIYSQCNDKEQAKQIDKHSVQMACGSKKLVIYDKTTQMENENLVGKSEKLPAGILRFEVQLMQKAIYKLAKEQGLGDNVDQIWHMMQSSQQVLLNSFSQCFLDVSFCQIEQIAQAIDQSNFKKKTKKQMHALSQQLQRKQSVDAAIEAMELSKADGLKLLKKFQTLAISPIPLWKNFCAQEIPGVVGLLKAIGTGDVEVEYEGKKK